MQNQASPPLVKSFVDSPAEREIFISKLRVATTRLKLRIALLEDFQIALRQKTISISGVVNRLREEGIRL
jgi:hypothetical protein